jgi:hypothetical protein
MYSPNGTRFSLERVNAGIESKNVHLLGYQSHIHEKFWICFGEHHFGGFAYYVLFGDLSNSLNRQPLSSCPGQRSSGQGKLQARGDKWRVGQMQHSVIHH